MWGSSLGLVEGKGEVLDAVLGAELHKEVGELFQLCGEPFYIVGRGDSAEQQHVVGEMCSSVCGCRLRAILQTLHLRM